MGGGHHHPQSKHDVTCCCTGPRPERHHRRSTGTSTRVPLLVRTNQPTNQPTNQLTTNQQPTTKPTAADEKLSCQLRLLLEGWLVVIVVCSVCRAILPVPIVGVDQSQAAHKSARSCAPLDFHDGSRREQHIKRGCLRVYLRAWVRVRVRVQLSALLAWVERTADSSCSLCLRHTQTTGSRINTASDANDSSKLSFFAVVYNSAVSMIATVENVLLVAVALTRVDRTQSHNA